MSVEEFIKSRIDRSYDRPLDERQQKLVKDKTTADAVYSLLTDTKFRRWSLSPESTETIRNAIKVSVEANQPLRLAFPFGGYKLWRLPIEPQVDWAEFFFLAYYLDWLTPVLNYYKPGVKFIMASDDVIISRMDNVPDANVTGYVESVKILIQEFAKFFPENLSVQVERVGDAYTPEELDAELEQRLTTARQEYPNLPPEKKDQYISSARLNWNPNGTIDYSHLSEKEIEVRLTDSVILDNAYRALSKRQAMYRNAQTVLVFCKSIPKAICLGVTKRSIVKFWTGIGVLMRSPEGELKEYILSPFQYSDSLEKIKNNVINLNLFPENFKNLQSIRVFEEDKNFGA